LIEIKNLEADKKILLVELKTRREREREKEKEKEKQEIQKNIIQRTLRSLSYLARNFSRRRRPQQN
jgi:hypothetical protein